MISLTKLANLSDNHFAMLKMDVFARMGIWKPLAQIVETEAPPVTHYYLAELCNGYG